MSTIAKLSGQARTAMGTSASRRMRAEGSIPANVYGHKQNPTPIVLNGDALSAVVRSGTRVVDLEVGGKTEKALVKDVQWDTFSTQVLHVDFLRVDSDEKVRIEIPISLRGTAPGVVSGGVLEIPHHTVMVECLAVEIPDFLIVRIAHLGIGDMVHVSDLTDVPAGVKILNSPETVLVHVVEPKLAPEPAPVAPLEAGSQPALVTPPGKEKEEAGKTS